jgi:hypothetical protein
MKPSILAAFTEAIPYIPGLRQQTGSVVSAILMMQIHRAGFVLIDLGQYGQ